MKNALIEIKLSTNLTSLRVIIMSYSYLGKKMSNINLILLDYDMWN